MSDLVSRLPEDKIMKQFGLMDQGIFDPEFAEEELMPQSSTYIDPYFALHGRTRPSQPILEGNIGDVYTAGKEFLSDPHNALATAGFATGILEPIGIGADIFDALLYLGEGDLWGAGYATAAAIPGLSLWARGAKQKAKAGRMVKEGEIIKETLMDGDTAFHQWNKYINNLGKESNYINPTTIKSIDGREYVVSTTGKFSDFLDEKRYVSKGWKVDGSSRRGPYGREIVIVKIKDAESGEEIFQPFYRSTGTGEPSMKSQGNWLPFEGHSPKASNAYIEMLEADGSISKFHGYNEDMVKFHKSTPDDIKSGKVSWSLLTDSKGYTTTPTPGGPGWYIKAFKNFDGNRVNTSISKTKRGLDVHEAIDHYLRFIWNR